MRRALLPLVLVLPLVLAGCRAESDGPSEPEAPPEAPAADPVERAADAAVRTLLDVEVLAEVLGGSGLERLTGEQHAAYTTWLAEVRAMAPAPPPLRYRLDTERFDPVARTWKVDVKIPSLQAALDAPESRLVLVLEPKPGETGPDAAFTIVEARLALR